MPIKMVIKDGRPGYQYGDSGKHYPYEPGNAKSRETAMRKAEEQRRAIKASQTSLEKHQP